MENFSKLSNYNYPPLNTAIEAERKAQSEMTGRPQAASLMDVEELSPELKILVDQLTFLDTKHLTRLATKTFPKKEAARIESLHYTEQSVGLTEKETSDLIELMKKFDRWFVLRNAALGRLYDLGIDLKS